MKAKEVLSKREKILDDYERGFGLPSIHLFDANEELQNYFIMDRSQVEKLSSYECSVISFRLSQYAFQMQRYVNRERSVAIYAESQLASIVSNHINDFDKYTKHEVKVESICKENVAAREWKQIILYAKQRVERINELSQGINNLAYRISMVQKHKEEK